MNANEGSSSSNAICLPFVALASFRGTQRASFVRATAVFPDWRALLLPTGRSPNPHLVLGTCADRAAACAVLAVLYGIVCFCALFAGRVALPMLLRLRLCARCDVAGARRICYLAV